MQQTVDLPDAVDVTVDNGDVTVSSGDQSVSKTLDHPDVAVHVENGAVVVETDSDRRDVTAVVGTYAAHIQNMVDGVTNGYEYVMKGFYAHFPMDMAVEGDTFVISNFIGERAPRHVAIPDTVDVTVDGEDVVVAGPDKEAVGQTAASIEQACEKGTRDPRKFQDGIYITERRVKEGDGR